MDRLKSLFFHRSLNCKNDPEKIKSISKEELAEKLKDHIKVSLEEIKNLNDNLQSAFEQTFVQNNENIYYNKRLNTVIDYLTIVRCLDQELRSLEKKSNDFVQKISNYKIKSLSVDNLIDLLDPDDENFDPLDITALFDDQLVPASETQLEGLTSQRINTDFPMRYFGAKDTFAINRRKYQKHECNYLLSSEKEEEEEDINCNTRIKRVPINNDSFTFKHKILIPKIYHNNPSSTCFSKQIDLVWKESYNDVQYSRSSKTICMEFVDDDEFIYITKLSLTLFKHKELTAINRIIFITSSTRIMSWFGRFLAWRFQVPSDIVNLYSLDNNGTVDDWKEWKLNGGVLFVDFDAFQRNQTELSLYNLINSHSPDLLIIDLNLPLDGDVPEDIKNIINDMFCSLKLILQTSK